jgi:hypothetical protein
MKVMFILSHLKVKTFVITILEKETTFISFKKTNNFHAYWLFKKPYIFYKAEIRLKIFNKSKLFS